MRTSTKTRFGVIVGLTVTLLRRPAPTEHKRYREPIVCLRKRCRSKQDAEALVNAWENMEPIYG